MWYSYWMCPLQKRDWLFILFGYIDGEKISSIAFSSKTSKTPFLFLPWRCCASVRGLITSYRVKILMEMIIVSWERTNEHPCNFMGHVSVKSWHTSTKCNLSNPYLLSSSSIVIFSSNCQLTRIYNWMNK